MTNITEQRELMLQHLKQLNKLSLKANIKHSSNVEKSLNHKIELTKFMKEDRAEIKRLKNVLNPSSFLTGATFFIDGWNNGACR